MRPFLVAALAAVVLPLVGCGDVGRALDDEAACPGKTCTQDTQDRLDAIAALDGVTEVERVARSYGLDEGSSREAAVRASVDDRAEARALLLEVLRELEEWPEHDAGTAVATVTSEPAVEVEEVARETEVLTNPAFEPCTAQACTAALEELRERMEAEIEGLRDLEVEVRAGVLRVTGTTGADGYALAAAGARRMVVEARVRLADRLEVEMTGVGPLALTLRLDDGLVCEQPPGTTVRCDDDDPDAVPFDVALDRAMSSGNS